MTPQRKQPNPRYGIEEWNERWGEWVLLPYPDSGRSCDGCRLRFSDLAAQRRQDSPPIRMVKVTTEVLDSHGELSPEDAKVAEEWGL